MSKKSTIEAKGNMFEPSNATTPSKPIWHAPWKLSRVIKGHVDVVWCIAVDQRNEWFATGSDDGIIKIWDLYSGESKLSLTGRYDVHGLAVGNHNSYLFSCGLDEQIKCWDIERNKVIRHYDGNLRVVHGLDFHDKLDLLVAGCCDATVRLWDVRTKVQTHCFRGHKDAVCQVRCRGNEPEIVSSSYTTIRLWDIVAGRERVTLHNCGWSDTFVLHPNMDEIAIASNAGLKRWGIPEGVFIQNIWEPGSFSALAINNDDVLVSGDIGGYLQFFDWSSARSFQSLRSTLPTVSGCFGISAMTFDRTDSRLITCEDNTIKVYVEDQNATEESHPLN